MRRTGRSPHRQALAHLSVQAVASTTSLGCHPCSHVGGGSHCRAKPYDDRRNAVKGKERFGVRGVHPPVPWIMDTVIDNAPAAGMRSRSPRDGVLNATLPRRAAPACVPDIRFWLAGDDAGTSGLRRFPTLTASSCALPLNPAATRYLD